MVSDKDRPHLLERKATLYVRQSSADQVLHNHEYSTLQHAGVQRADFERMVAEVCLGKVGAVCAREVSRFARNGRDSATCAQAKARSCPLATIPAKLSGESAEG
jgi:hypothetical protein